MKVVKFDIMDYIWQWNQYAFWGFDQSQFNIVSQQMTDIGYNDRNAFSALGSVAIIIFIYFLKLITSLILKIFLYLFCFKSKFIIKFEKKFSEGMYFENILNVLIEAIIEILICSFMNY